MNPNAPHIYGTIKLHKHLKPIRSTVNWKNSPYYKLDKFIGTKLKDIIQLPNAYNIQNSINLIHNLKNVTTDNNIKFFSFDIRNIYTNIPLTKVTNMIKTSLTIRTK
jgi:hypothetical protein